MDALLPIKNTLDELKMRIKDTKRALDDVLEEDDYMDMMSSLRSSPGGSLAAAPARSHPASGVNTTHGM